MSSSLRVTVREWRRSSERPKDRQSGRRGEERSLSTMVVLRVKGLVRVTTVWCEQEMRADEIREVAGDEASLGPFLVTVELAASDGARWSALGGGETLEEAIGFACASAPSGRAWRVVRVGDLYGE